MREIKFRVWDKKSKKIREVISIIYTNISFDYMDYETFNEIKLVWLKGRDTIYDKDIQISRKKSECELMQYTGLKDKNGVEIYEGDIIVYCNDVYYEVVWEESKAVEFKISKQSEIKYPGICKQYFGFNANKHIEVIGNIYENKKLLEKDK